MKDYDAIDITRNRVVLAYYIAFLSPLIISLFTTKEIGKNIFLVSCSQLHLSIDVNSTVCICSFTLSNLGTKT